MSEAIGIRLNEGFLKKIERLSNEEVTDRSTTIRQLIHIGYDNLMKKKAAERYMQGKITISEAASISELTVWEMEEFLVKQGYRSEYSIEDMENEMRLFVKGK